MIAIQIHCTCGWKGTVLSQQETPVCPKCGLSDVKILNIFHDIESKFVYVCKSCRKATREERWNCECGGIVTLEKGYDLATKKAQETNHLQCTNCFRILEFPISSFYCPYCGGRLKQLQKNQNSKKREKSMVNYTRSSYTISGMQTAGFWESDVKVLEECGHAPKGIKISFLPIVKSKISALMREYKSIEWLAYLVGDGEDPHKIIDLVIPSQRVSTARVDDIEFENTENLQIIGVIHSHHSMGNSFSHTDDEYINQNHDISLCVSHGGIQGQVRWKSPCGAYIIVDATLVMDVETDLDEDAFIADAKEKIKEGYSYSNRYNGGYYNQGYLYGAAGGMSNFREGHEETIAQLGKERAENANVNLSDEEVREILGEEVYGDLISEIEEIENGFIIDSVDESPQYREMTDDLTFSKGYWYDDNGQAYSYDALTRKYVKVDQETDTFQAVGYSEKD